MHPKMPCTARPITRVQPCKVPEQRSCTCPRSGRQSRLPRLGSAATLGRGKEGVNRQWLGSIGALRVFFSSVDDVALDVLPAPSITASWLFGGVLEVAAPPVPYGADACRLGTAGSFVVALPVALLCFLAVVIFGGAPVSLFPKARWHRDRRFLYLALRQFPVCP